MKFLMYGFLRESIVQVPTCPLKYFRQYFQFREDIHKKHNCSQLRQTEVRFSGKINDSKTLPITENKIQKNDNRKNDNRKKLDQKSDSRDKKCML